MNGDGTSQGWHSTANVFSRRIESQDQIRIGERLGIYLRPGEIISGIVTETGIIGYGNTPRMNKGQTIINKNLLDNYANIMNP